MPRKFRPARRLQETPGEYPGGETAKPPSAAVQPAKPRKRADRGPGVRLTFADRYRILEMHRANPEMPYTVLAERTGVNVETARLTCIAAGKSAADLMAAYAEPMIKKWIVAAVAASARGDHRPAKDWLLHAGVLDPLPETGRGSGPSVVIINSPLPGMPGYTPPEIITLPLTTPKD